MFFKSHHLLEAVLARGQRAVGAFDGHGLAFEAGFAASCRILAFESGVAAPSANLPVAHRHAGERGLASVLEEFIAAISGVFRLAAEYEERRG